MDQSPTLLKISSVYLSNHPLLLQVVKVIILKETKALDMLKVIKQLIIYRYWVPQTIIHDSWSQFTSQAFYKLCDKFKIKMGFNCLHSNHYGHSEAFNKTMIKLLKKLVKKNKCDWHEILDEILWTYSTIVYSPTNTTPFSLIYGYEIVFLLEIQIPWLCTALVLEMTTQKKKKKPSPSRIGE